MLDFFAGGNENSIDHGGMRILEEMSKNNSKQKIEVYLALSNSLHLQNTIISDISIQDIRTWTNQVTSSLREIVISFGLIEEKQKDIRVKR